MCPIQNLLSLTSCYLYLLWVIHTFHNRVNVIQPTSTGILLTLPFRFYNSSNSLVIICVYMLLLCCLICILKTLHSVIWFSCFLSSAKMLYIWQMQQIALRICLHYPLFIIFIKDFFQGYFYCCHYSCAYRRNLM